LSDGSKITGTHSHPVWVPAAQAWVPIKDLRQGMFLDSQHGSVFVVSIELHSLPQDVYNIEVHGEHVYRVGDAAILVHNNNPLCDEYWDLKTRKNNGETVDEARLAELERIVGPRSEALIPVGKYLNSIDDVLVNPQLLAGKTPAEVQAIVGKTPGWSVERLGKGAHKGQGWVLREFNDTGMPTGRMLRWHPGGGHHGPSPYWRVNSHQIKSGIIPGGSI
jgi:hypothetical protein